MNKRLVLCLLLVASIFVSPVFATFTPQKGDYLKYHEVAIVNNGGGSYTGYSDQTVNDGSISITATNGTMATAHWGYTYVFGNNQQSNTTTMIRSGAFTFNSSNFFYLNGTDYQSYCFGTMKYSNPSIWFAIDPKTPVGGKFALLSTVFTIDNRNASYANAAYGVYQETIHAKGTGTYHCDNDPYGTYDASYTWDVWFDPVSGYIVGYHYVEQENGQYQGSAMTFTYTDDLYITSASYSPISLGSLQTQATSSTSSIPSGVNPPSGFDLGWLGWIAVFLVGLVVIVVLVGRIGRRNDDDEKLPISYHPPSPPPAPSPIQPRTIDLEPKRQPPVQQVVIRDVAKVACQYCGTLVATTTDLCPHCGGRPR
jgi:hypothetical protein